MDENVSTLTDSLKAITAIVDKVLEKVVKLEKSLVDAPLPTAARAALAELRTELAKLDEAIPDDPTPPVVVPPPPVVVPPVVVPEPPAPPAPPDAT